MAVLNRKELLATTLEGYARYPRYEDTELVITDYGSTDNLEGLLERARSGNMRRYRRRLVRCQYQGRWTSRFELSDRSTRRAKWGESKNRRGSSLWSAIEQTLGRLS